MLGIWSCLIFFCLCSGAVQSAATDNSKVYIDVVPKLEDDQITKEDLLKEFDEDELRHIQVGHHGCPPFEEYLTCGPTCQITCNTIGETCPQGPCQRGCYCQKGKVRSTRTGKCISQKFCSGQ